MKYSTEEIRKMLEGPYYEIEEKHAREIISDLLAENERYRRKCVELGSSNGCPPNKDCGDDDWTCAKCWAKYWEEE